jgi:2-polyprenyl-3-methyl-5-hydroxy-6-metoxy-1,4-benzoquinol methylase
MGSTTESIGRLAMKSHLLTKRTLVRRTIADHVEVIVSRAKERIRGVDCSIFDPTIAFYSARYGEHISRSEALQRALNKKAHKDAWYAKPRRSNADIVDFYKDVHVYPFRQPYNKRHGGFRWYLDWVKDVPKPKVLEYGCGSAVLTERLYQLRPNASYHVADIPSVTLEFVCWKREEYRLPFTVLEIGEGKDGIPLVGDYDLIICQDVLEHTPNPLEIATAFTQHLSPGGTPIIDFLNAPGGENLSSAAEQRESVKHHLKSTLTAIKAIDEPYGNDGVYRRV